MASWVQISAIVCHLEVAARLVIYIYNSSIVMER